MAHVHCFHSRGPDRLHCSICRGLVHVEGNDVRPLTAEDGRNGLTNPRAAAGDDSEFAGEVKQDAARGELLYFSGKVKEAAALRTSGFRLRPSGSWPGQKPEAWSLESFLNRYR